MYIEGFLHEQTVEEGTKQSKTIGAEALPQDIGPTIRRDPPFF